MASNIDSDGTTVTVTTGEGHRIGFAMEELGVPSTMGEITTEWANGVPPDSVERTVLAAKKEAEAYAAEHHSGVPAEARAKRDQDRGLGDTLKDMIGLP